MYEGVVWHARHRPVRNQFEYRLFLMYLDLAELDDVFEGRLLWSTRRPALARFRRKDHLGDAGVPLDAAVRDLVAERCGERPAGPIRLLTHLSYFGYCFNPVSIYYCFDSGDRRVEFVIAEVSNTPWGERHCYAIDVRDQTGPRLNQRLQKEFHVSPFMGMDLEYRWDIGIPGDSLAVSMQSFDARGKLFDATLNLDRVEISGASLARALLAHPFVTGKVIAAIYLQALRLLIKRAPFFPHPGERSRPSRE